MCELSQLENEYRGRLLISPKVVLHFDSEVVVKNYSIT